MISRPGLGTTLVMQFASSHSGLPQGLNGKDSTCPFRRCAFYLWVGKIPGKKNDNPLQYSSLGNLMDRGAWRATESLGLQKSWMTAQLNNKWSQRGLVCECRMGGLVSSLVKIQLSLPYVLCVISFSLSH